MKISTMRRHFVQTLYKTLEDVVSPTPFLRITDGDMLNVEYLDGRGKLPADNATEITALDIEIASLFFDDFNILLEGVTGIGKTYTSDALFNTIFGPDGHYTLRLSGGIMGNSALEPFTKTILDGSMPKTVLDPDSFARYGALFIDEINRGDSQEVLQVVDGVINSGGETGYLGMQIPGTALTMEAPSSPIEDKERKKEDTTDSDTTKEKIEYTTVPIPGTERLKKLAIIAAMNPADAEHSDARQLDLAGENRFLKFTFPNGVAEAGSTQLDKQVPSYLHDEFWSTLSKRLRRKNDWRTLYPLITDAQAIDSSPNGVAYEFLDTSLGFVGYDPHKTIDHNNEIIREVGISSQLSGREDNEYNIIREAQSNLKHSFVRRDLRKIQDLARLLGFVRGVKNGSYETAVSLNDVAAAMSITIESKQIVDAEYGSMLHLINDARKAYSEIHEQTGFPKEDSIRQFVWQGAVNAGSDYGWEGYVATLDSQIDRLNVQGKNHAQTTIASRLVADLAVLKHFSNRFRSDLEGTLSMPLKEGLETFEEVYKEHKGAGSIYEHRLAPMFSDV